jgi:hypothetical protein
MQDNQPGTGSATSAVICTWNRKAFFKQPAYRFGRHFGVGARNFHVQDRTTGNGHEHQVESRFCVRPMSIKEE